MTSSPQGEPARTPRRSRAASPAQRGSCGELLQDVFHSLRALLPGGQLRFHTQALRPGEARIAAGANEVDDLCAVYRRILDELELDGLVRGVDAGDSQRPRRNADLVAFEQGTRRFW